MKPYLKIKPRPIEGAHRSEADDPDNLDPKSLAEGRSEEAYGHDSRIDPQPVPAEKYPLNPAMDANPHGKKYAKSDRDRGERGVGGTGLGLLLLAIIGLAILGYFVFTGNSPTPNPATNNQTTNESVQPKTVDENQPTNTQPQPDTGTGTLPAQPVKPEQPAGSTTTQP